MGLSRSISGLGHAAANGFVKWSNFSKPNFAAVLHGINDMRFEEFPLASTLKEGQVLSCLMLWLSVAFLQHFTDLHALYCVGQDRNQGSRHLRQRRPL